MVEQPAARAHAARSSVAKYSSSSRRADVLEHADRADRVERAVVHVAVVLHADLDAVVEPGVVHRAPRPLGLALRERDADRVHAVVRAPRA